MSRIGRQAVMVPSAVSVSVADQIVTAKGPKGQLSWQVPNGIKIDFAKGALNLTRSADDANSKSLHGLSRALLYNMVKGVSDGFVKKLEIHGVGFKASVQGNSVNLILGFSHVVEYPIPAQAKVTVEENTKLTIEGPDKAVVGKIAAEIRSYYPPEPYKGKGVRYLGERVERKEGKTVQ